MSNPDLLTKSQLKEELQAHGVEVPSGNVLKSVYVDLYNKHITKQMQGFSSDDMAMEASSSSKKNKRRSRTSSTPVDISSLSQLTNEEIASKLKELGQAIGPVTRTTRQLYLNQLRKLLQSEGASGQGQYSDRDTDSEEAQPTVAVTRSSSRRRSSYQATEKPPIVTRKSTSSTTRSVAARSEHETSDFSSTPSTASATKRRPLRGSMSAAGKEEQTQVEAKTSQRAKTPVKAKTVKSERRWIPIWIQGIVTALLVLFIYLVIQAMEANPKPPSLP